MSNKTTQQSLESLGIQPYPLKSDEKYMNDAQIRHFRKILMAQKERLMSRVDETVHHFQGDLTAHADPLDRASQDEEVNLELRTRDRERKLLRKVNESLDSLNKGEYGYCIDCGSEIGVRRLEARPTATQCIDCKSFYEVRERGA